MAELISRLAVIHPGARLGRDVSIAPFVLIEDDVVIGDNCDIGPQVVLRAGTRIGAGCALRTGVVLGDPPMDSAFQGERSGVTLGDRNDLREYVTIHRATGEGENTVLGDGNLIMPYTHVAHNSRIGSHVTITNACQLAGHVQVEDNAVIGGMTGIHQFTRIGAHSMVGACSYLAKDLPPFMIGAGKPFRVRGVNRVGLHRAGFTSAQLDRLRELHRIVYRSSLNLTDAISEIRKRFPDFPPGQQFIAFAENSKRGIQLRDDSSDELRGD
jgi:UDP-N-acetylglucosamine acyltransferase